MLYFKNVELAEKYRVSLGTIRNWIEASQNGKIDLSLKENNGRYFIANSTKNISTMDELVAKGKKYRNSRAVRKVRPKKSFYDLYTEEQIYDMVRNLELHREIPFQYNYFDGGAEVWDGYSSRLAKSNDENSFNRAQMLLKASVSFLESMTEQYDKINVVDIGPGNGMPAKWLLEFLMERGKLGRYIALDISQAMLDIVEDNVKEWFGGKVDYEGYVRNINQDRFSDVLIQDFTNQEGNRANLILHLGFTLRNMQNPDNGYRTIYDSISVGDMLIEDDLLDTDTSRSYFDFDFDDTSHLLGNLNLNQSFYDMEVGFDEETWQRYLRIRFKIAVDIEFDFGDSTRTITFDKGESVLLWRNKHKSVDETLAQKKRAGFSLAYMCKTSDFEHMLTISRIKVTRSEDHTEAN